MAERQPSLADLWRFIQRDPRLAAQFSLPTSVDTAVPSNASLGEAAASMDLGGLSALSRLFGKDLSTNVRINEVFGDLDKFQRPR